VKYIDDAMEVANHSNTEFFYPEELAFRVVGFGSMFDIARKDMQDLTCMRNIIQAAPGTALDVPLAQALQPDMAIVFSNSEKFGPEVAAAVVFAKTLASALTVMSFMMLELIFFLLRRSTLRPIEEALAFAKRIAGGDLAGQITPLSRDEYGQLFHALGQMNDNLAHIAGQVRCGAETILIATREVVSGNADLSSRTEAEAGSLEETVSSIG